MLALSFCRSAAHRKLQKAISSDGLRDADVKGKVKAFADVAKAKAVDLTGVAKAKAKDLTGKAKDLLEGSEITSIVTGKSGKCKYNIGHFLWERKYEFAGVENASIEEASMNLQGWNAQVRKHKYIPVNTVSGYYSGTLTGCRTRLK